MHKTVVACFYTSLLYAGRLYYSSFECALDRLAVQRSPDLLPGRSALQGERSRHHEDGALLGHQHGL